MAFVININSFAVEEAFSNGSCLPEDRAGKLFLDDEGDLFIGSTFDNSGLVRVYSSGDVYSGGCISWPVRLAPASYSITFQN